MGSVVIKCREYDVETTVKLRFINVEITDGELAEIGKLVNLKEMTLYNSGIKDISLLCALICLEWLMLSQNQISDLKPLAGLTKLKTLILAENQICNVSPIADLTKMP